MALSAQEMGQNSKRTQRVPMSRKGNCINNSPMKNFFGLMKQEMYHGESLRTYEDLKRDIESYINYYNNNRIKQKLAGMSPVQYRLHNSQLTA
ncbi:IS3 family transposase [Virgibacillus sediminis]|uniref:IS3 family transposase n=1 Tax=Virgibacillus sediminis TaxID=202260 RepID=A0ABV7A5K0_9BACI